MGVLTVPAPVGGINRLANAAGDPRFAADLYEWIPRGSYLEMRHSFTTLIATIAAFDLHGWNGADGTYKIVAAGYDTGTLVNGLYSITTAGVATLVYTSASPVWHSNMFQDKLILTVSGATPQIFNGTTCSDIVVTGVTANTISNSHTFKGRVYYWKLNATSFWYAAAGSYQGVLTEFPLDTVTARGGFIIAMATIQQQGGEGADDLAAFIFSTGEIVVYQGDDPSAARSWQMIGKVHMGQPISTFSICKVGPTVLIWTTDGIVDLRNVIATGIVTPDAVISTPLGDEMRFISTSPQTNNGKYIVYFPEQSLVIAFSAPGGFTGDSTMFVFETTQKAWTKWKPCLKGAGTGPITSQISMPAVIGGVLYLATANAGGIFKYNLAGVADSASNQGTAFANILAYSRQNYVKLQNGKVGMLTTASPRTNYDNTQYLTCRVTVDMAGTTYDYPTDTPSWYTSDPATTPTTLATTVYAGVTSPQFAVTVPKAGESFSLVMVLSQQRARPIRWYETRLGWKMGGSR